MADRSSDHSKAVSPASGQLRSPAEAFALFGAMLAATSVERIVAAYLSGESLIAVVDVSLGDAMTAVLPIASVLREAMMRGADAILLAHNHPAGDPAPSAEDLRVTRRFADAAAALGIRLVDHVIVAGGGCLSLRMMGLL
jgi:DNA repair protein RadC